MFDLHEMYRIMNELAQEFDKPEVIKVNVLVTADSIQENLPSGVKGKKYDDQTIDDWFDFLGTIEGFVDNYCDVVNTSMSKQPDSLSEYIDFYVYDQNGQKKNYLINLRLSDHSSTNAARRTRKRNASKLNTRYKLFSVTVNNRTFKSYSEAENYIRELIFKESF